MARGRSETTAFRGRLLHFLDEPGGTPQRAPLADADLRPHALGTPLPPQIAHLPDGLLIVRHGLVVAAIPADEGLRSLPPGTRVVDHRGKLLLPGFVDCHTHYAQTDVIASYGEQLLAWLERYTFPAECRFEDAAHARSTAEFFLDELLRNGTTTAMVLGTVHAASVDALCAAAQTRSMRLIAGKLLMDRHCPEPLRDTAASGAAESRALIERWHGRGRLHYALTPRFAPTSSEEQLRLCGELAAQHPDVYIQTHLAENRRELDWVARLFPWSGTYLDVYERFGLVRERAIYAHCIHLDDDDRRQLARRGAAAAFCPSANLFLGSGLFDLRKAREVALPVALGTDVGAGTSFSLLRTMQDAYKVAQLAHQRLSPFDAFYMATRGGARALRLDDRIGSFEPGREADFVVLDLAATPLLARRTALAAGDLEAELFALMVLGDDRSVEQTYVLGKPTLPVGRRRKARGAPKPNTDGTRT